jgi:hypothetical protein
MVMAKGRVKKGLRRMRAGFEWTLTAAMVGSNLENFRGEVILFSFPHIFAGDRNRITSPRKFSKFDRAVP